MMVKEMIENVNIESAASRETIIPQGLTCTPIPTLSVTSNMYEHKSPKFLYLFKGTTEAQQYHVTA